MALATLEGGAAQNVATTIFASAAAFWTFSGARMSIATAAVWTSTQ